MNISIAKVIWLLQVSALTSNPNFHSFNLIAEMPRMNSERIRIQHHVLISIAKLAPFHILTLSIATLIKAIAASIVKSFLFIHALLLPLSVIFLAMITIIKVVLLMTDHSRTHLPTHVLFHRRASSPVHTSSWAS